MDLDQILARLRRHEADLHARGVCRAAVFGSRARGDNRPDSDIDIMVELLPDARMDVYTFVGLQLFISDLLEGPVDVVQREGLKRYILPHVAADAVYAF